MKFLRWLDLFQLADETGRLTIIPSVYTGKYYLCFADHIQFEGTPEEIAEWLSKRKIMMN